MNEFRFFFIIDGKKKITTSHRLKPNKVIYRVRCLNDGEVFNNASEAAKKYSLNPSQISFVCKGKIQHTGGKMFENIDWLDRKTRTGHVVAKVNKLALEAYTRLLDAGVCPEQARMVLPQSMMTQWYWTGTLYAFARVCNLRCKPDAQLETAEICWEIKLKLY